MSLDPSIYGPATLAISSAISLFTTYLPPITEVRKASVDDCSMAADVRMGEVAAVSVTMGVGFMVGTLTSSSVPVLVSAGMSLALVALYESTLRAHRPFERI